LHGIGYVGVVHINFILFWRKRLVLPRRMGKMGYKLHIILLEEVTGIAPEDGGRRDVNYILQY